MRNEQSVHEAASVRETRGWERGATYDIENRNIWTVKIRRPTRWREVTIKKKHAYEKGGFSFEPTNTEECRRDQLVVITILKTAS